MMEKGFTLLEVIVVLAIISIFAGIVGTVIGTTVLNTEIRASEEKMETLTEALLSFYADTDRFPTATGVSSVDLTVLVNRRNVRGWNGPYISSGFGDNDFMKDAWKRDLLYSHSPGTAVCTLTSNGPDGVPGTDDDMRLLIDATAVYRRKVDRVRRELEVLKAAAQAYATANGGTYPDGIGSLFDGGHLSDGSYRRDEWLVEYQTENGQFISYGPDGVPGGGDDIYPY
jgi:general secretion pathway protein G